MYVHVYEYALVCVWVHVWMCIWIYISVYCVAVLEWVYVYEQLLSTIMSRFYCFWYTLQICGQLKTESVFLTRTDFPFNWCQFFLYPNIWIYPIACLRIHECISWDMVALFWGEVLKDCTENYSLRRFWIWNFVENGNQNGSHPGPAEPSASDIFLESKSFLSPALFA